jgi:hypothetical protein
MGIKNALENRMRGWFPKEPNLPSFSKTSSRENKYSHKIKPPIGAISFFCLFIIQAIGWFLEGDVAGVSFLWFSCILGVFIALNILAARGKELNLKLAAGLLVITVSLGGILANLYVFSVPSSLFTRAFSLVMLVLVNVPLLLGILAYVWGKKDLSKKLIGWYSAQR